MRYFFLPLILVISCQASNTTDPPALATKIVKSEEQVAFETALHLGIVSTIHKQVPKMDNTMVRRISVAIVKAGQTYNIDPQLITAVAYQESRFNPYLTSPCGARGLLQVIPLTGRTMATASNIGFLGDNQLYDIETNIALGARYLAGLIRNFHDESRALLAYNRGEGGARAVLKLDTAEDYLAGYPREVLRARRQIRALAEPTELALR